MNPGVFTTLCTVCNRTCHEICRIGPGRTKEHCSAMFNGKCKICPKKCHFSVHHNSEYILKWDTREREQTLDELKKLYCDAKSSKSNSEQIIEGFAGQLEKITLACLSVQNRLQVSMKKLNEIALQPNSFETTNEYFDLMIQNEKDNKEKEWNERIIVIQQFKEKNNQIEKLSKEKSFVHKTKQQIIDELMENESGKEEKTKDFWSNLFSW